MVDLAELPRGISVFVDANILVYYFAQMPPLTQVCKAFFERVSRLEIKAFTSAHVAADVIHRIMLAEAIATLGLAPREAVSYLSRTLTPSNGCSGIGLSPAILPRPVSTSWA